MSSETVDGTTYYDDALPTLGASDHHLALTIAWSRYEPGRVGETALLPPQVGRQILGRGPAGANDPAPRLVFARHRPGIAEPTGPLGGKRISRLQLALEPRGDGIEVEVLGRCKTRVGQRVVERATVKEGDLLVLERELVLLVEQRPALLPPPVDRMPPEWRFGTADPDGIVGEAPASWRLREHLGFVGPRPAHALLLGPSGTGKELAARALHRLSSRRDRPLVARNVATLPEGLIDAELFGNVRNYPNPGMPQREGLVGEANGSSLFLDELGELPEALQAHLLRVMDEGEYQRLGDSRARKADLRVIGATNRPVDSLKHDVAARLPMRLELPGLGERPADIPLLARAFIVALAREDPTMAQRFLVDGEPQFDGELIEGLLNHEWTTHVRELHQILWASMASSGEGRLRRTEEVEALLSERASAPTPPEDLSPSEIQEALDRNGGNQAATYRDLGLSSRDALYRLIKKHGLVVRRT